MEELNTNNFIHEHNKKDSIQSDVRKIEKGVGSIIICDNHLEGTDTAYYKDAASYWGNVDPSVNGMLGGFGEISSIDIEGSSKFLKGLYKVNISTRPHIIYRTGQLY